MGVRMTTRGGDSSVMEGMTKKRFFGGRRQWFLGGLKVRQWFSRAGNGGFRGVQQRISSSGTSVFCIVCGSPGAFFGKRSSTSFRLNCIICSLFIQAVGAFRTKQIQIPNSAVEDQNWVDPYCCSWYWLVDFDFSGSQDVHRGTLCWHSRESIFSSAGNPGEACLLLASDTSQLFALASLNTQKIHHTCCTGICTC